jgi:hypothetical protein
LLEIDDPFGILSVGVASVDDDGRMPSVDIEWDESIIHNLEAGGG